MRQHTAESPSVHDQFSDASVTIITLDDAPAYRPDDPVAAEAEYRATHCEACGDVTPGTVVAGAHIQRCDRCLGEALRSALELIEGHVA